MIALPAHLAEPYTARKTVNFVAVSRITQRTLWLGRRGMKRVVASADAAISTQTANQSRIGIKLVTLNTSAALKTQNAVMIALPAHLAGITVDTAADRRLPVAHTKHPRLAKSDKSAQHQQRVADFKLAAARKVVGFDRRDTRQADNVPQNRKRVLHGGVFRRFGFGGAARAHARDCGAQQHSYAE
jgi:hypothetical protein